MGFIELLLIGTGLAMDAFAVSLCKGLNMRKINYSHTTLIALFFGGFQALMPLIGWFLGSQFSGYIQRFDHWVAFVLLAFIGGNMIREALGGEEEETACAVGTRLHLKQLLLMAIATSIDALAVGVTFAFLEVAIVSAVLIIGCTTFALSVAGVAVGNFFGVRYKKRAELTGGLILVLMGTKILLEHLGILTL
jgi:putative Mn2+ efflux pump MntP